MFNKEKKFEKLKKSNLQWYLSRCNPLDVDLTEFIFLFELKIELRCEYFLRRFTLICF